MLNIAPSLKRNRLVHFLLREIVQHAHAIRKVELKKQSGLFHHDATAKAHTCHRTDVVRLHGGFVQFTLIRHGGITLVVVGAFPTEVAIEPEVETRSNIDVRSESLIITQIPCDGDAHLDCVHPHRIIDTSERRGGITGQKLRDKDLV